MNEVGNGPDYPQALRTEAEVRPNGTNGAVSFPASYLRSCRKREIFVCVEESHASFGHTEPSTICSMEPSRTVRILTLVFFGLFVTGFVAFESGVFDSYFTADIEEQAPESSPDGDQERMTTNTARRHADDTIRKSPSMLSTSKSMIIMKQDIRFSAKDSIDEIPRK